VSAARYTLHAACCTLCAARCTVAPPAHRSVTALGAGLRALAGDTPGETVDRYERLPVHGFLFWDPDPDQGGSLAARRCWLTPI